MLDKGINTALKSGEVQGQTKEFQKKISETSSVQSSADLFDALSSDNISEQQVLKPVESVDNSSKEVALFQDTSGLGQEKRSAGRPKGAKNKSTKEWVEYFLNRCKSPLMFLGQVITEDTETLARKMCANRIEVLKVQVGAANALLPYIHQKQPLAIENIGDELPTIQIFTSPTTFNQLNAGDNRVKKEIIIDGISSATPQQIDIKNNNLIELEKAESEK